MTGNPINLHGIHGNYSVFSGPQWIAQCWGLVNKIHQAVNHLNPGAAKDAAPAVETRDEMVVEINDAVEHLCVAVGSEDGWLDMDTICEHLKVLGATREEIVEALRTCDSLEMKEDQAVRKKAGGDSWSNWPCSNCRNLCQRWCGRGRKVDFVCSRPWAVSEELLLKEWSMLYNSLSLSCCFPYLSSFCSSGMSQLMAATTFPGNWRGCEGRAYRTLLWRCARTFMWVRIRLC